MLSFDQVTLDKLQVRYAVLRNVQASTACDICIEQITSGDNSEKVMSGMDVDSKLDSSDMYEVYCCDLCGVTVHRGCYRRDLMHPSAPTYTQWFCQRCTHLLHTQDPHSKNDALISATAVKCFLCEDLTGIIIRVYNKEQPTTTHDNQRWVHVTCVNWIPQIYFEELPQNFSKQGSEWFSGTSGKIKGKSLPKYMFDGNNCQFC